MGMQLQNRITNVPKKKIASEAGEVEREIILSRARQQLSGDIYSDSLNISPVGVQILERAWDILQSESDLNFIPLKLDVLYVLTDTFLQRQAFDKIELYICLCLY